MREKMRKHLGKDAKDGKFSLKQGSGGIVDIEFMVQFAVLGPRIRHLGRRTRRSYCLLDAVSLDPRCLLDFVPLDTAVIATTCALSVVYVPFLLNYVHSTASLRT